MLLHCCSLGRDSSRRFFELGSSTCCKCLLSIKLLLQLFLGAVCFCKLLGHRLQLLLRCGMLGFKLADDVLL